MSAVLPEHIDRYQIIEELGRGSMGCVYLAFDPKLERKLALKVLSPERLQGGDLAKELRQRFLVEALAAGRLNHPGVVTVYDADTDADNGQPYLAMEWIRGESLRDLLRREGPLDFARALGLAAQAARALDYAHRQEVVHRDIKPANLLITAEDDRTAVAAEWRSDRSYELLERVKIADFGIAKLLSASITSTGQILGSPNYMAPEQVQGEKVDHRADLFSLGGVLYECLTGRPAFSASNLARVTFKIVSVDPRPVGIYRPNAPRHLTAVVSKALEKAPDERFQTGAAFADALDEVRERLTADTAVTMGDGKVVDGAGDGEIVGSAPAVTSTDDDDGSVTEASPAMLPAVQVSPQSPAKTATQAADGGVAKPVAEPSGLGDGIGQRPWIESKSGSRIQMAGALALVALLVGLLTLLTGGDSEPARAALDTPEPVQEAAVDVSADNSTDDLPIEPSETSPPVVDVLPAADDPAANVPAADDPVATEPASNDSAPEVTNTSDDTAEPSVPSVRPRKTRLTVHHRSHLKLAYITIWIDRQRVLSQRLEVAGWFQRRRGQDFTFEVPVVVGSHKVEAHVSGVSRQIEARGVLSGEFEVGERRAMDLVVDRETQRLELSWRQ